MQSINRRMKKLITIFLLSISSLVSAKTISVVIPFSAGGPTDHLWRSIEPSMNERLKKHGIRLITENMPGAGGAIAGNKIAETRDRPLLGFFSPALAIAPGMNPEAVRYNNSTIKLIGYAGETEMFVVSKLSTEAFLKKCKSKPLFFGSSNVGSTSHLLGLVVGKELKCKELIHVPYKGLAPAYLDLISSRIDYLVDFAINAESQISSGSVNKIFTMDEQFSNRLENWHVFISNNIDDPDIQLIEKEFHELKKDRVFVTKLENSLRIKNFAIVRDNNWLIKEFKSYKTFVEKVK
jgi:tripartite-type tricarboxylate transporter receptor subunit TctC